MSKVMMKCGCAANSTCSSLGGKVFDPPIPACVVHDCIEQVPTPDLTGRQAKCAYCQQTRPSSPDLAFFEHHPNWPMDAYYCGCHGWD